MNTLLETRLERLLTHWEDVEKSIKEAEQLQGQVTVPAINELRYAGRQIVRAISLARKLDDADSAEIFEKSLTCAEQYVTNADNDVVDSIVLYIGSRINELNLRFGRDAIEKHYPGYKNICVLVDECKKKIAISRQVAPERKKIYADLRNNDIPMLINSHSDLYKSDLMMAVEAERNEKRYIRLQLWLYLSAATSLVFIGWSLSGPASAAIKFIFAK